MKRDEYHKKVHQEQLVWFDQVVEWVRSGKFLLLSVRIDKEQFGAWRVVIFLKSVEQDGTESATPKKKKK